MCMNLSAAGVALLVAFIFTSLFGSGVGIIVGLLTYLFLNE